MLSLNYSRIVAAFTLTAALFAAGPVAAQEVIEMPEIRIFGNRRDIARREVIYRSALINLVRIHYTDGQSEVIGVPSEELEQMLRTPATPSLPGTGDEDYRHPGIGGDDLFGFGTGSGGNTNSHGESDTWTDENGVIHLPPVNITGNPDAEVEEPWTDENGVVHLPPVHITGNPDGSSEDPRLEAIRRQVDEALAPLRELTLDMPSSGFTSDEVMSQFD